MHRIEQLITSHLPRSRSTSGGWRSFDAPCCHHRGHGPDRRARGGIKFNPDGTVGINCFNCGFSTGWRPGQMLGFKLKAWLGWIGVDHGAVNALTLWCLDQRDEAAVLEQYNRPEVEIKRYPVPESAVPIAQCTNPKIIDYLTQRGVLDDRFKFYWSPDTVVDLCNRVIVPFYYHNELVGSAPRAPSSMYSVLTAGRTKMKSFRKYARCRILVVTELKKVSASSGWWWSTSRPM